MRKTVKGSALALTSALALMAGAGAAQAQCSLKGVQVLSDGVFVSYDPFDRQPDRTALPLRITSTGCDGARLELTIVPEIDSLSSTGGSGSNGGQAMDLDLTVDGNPARIVPNAISAFAMTNRPARLAAGSGQLKARVRIELPYGEDVAPGRYRARANLIARVLDQDGAPGREVSAPFFIEVDVQPSFRLAAGVERSRLWLGELTAGDESQPLTFLAFSNTRYALKVRSEHNGRMTLDGSKKTDAPGVPYALSISDRDLDWIDGEGELRFPRPRFLLTTHEVVATTGEVDDRRPAGDYQDWVTIEISPLIS